MIIDDRKPSDEVEDSAPHPEHSHVDEFREHSSTRLKVAVVLFVFLAAVAATYGWLQHDAAQQLASERADLTASLAQAKSQEDVLTAKVNALSAAQAEEEAARTQSEAVKNEQFPPRASEVPERTVHHHHAAARHASVDDPRWKQVQEQLGDQQKALAESEQRIAETQANLQQTKSDIEQTKSEMDGKVQSARTDLGTDIARNHSELVALEKKGERTYYEFSFEKSKTYHHTGPISIALHKADSKHGSCDLQMLVDDRAITRKHVNLYESVAMHPEGYPQPLEVVINRIDKNSVQGYVSEPKYRVLEQSAAAAAAPASPTASVNPPAPGGPETKLSPRQDTAH